MTFVEARNVEVLCMIHKWNSLKNPFHTGDMNECESTMESEEFLIPLKILGVRL